MGEWERWMLRPWLAAQGSKQLNQVPQALMGLFVNYLRHPKFQDPEWYARVGSYLLAAWILKGKAGPALKYTGRLKIFEPLAAHADRLWGGPGTKTPIKGPDGQIHDYNTDHDS